MIINRNKQLICTNSRVCNNGIPPMKKKTVGLCHCICFNIIPSVVHKELERIRMGR